MMRSRAVRLALVLAALRGVAASAQVSSSDSATAAARQLVQDALRFAESGDTVDAIDRAARATAADAGLAAWFRRSDANHEFDQALRLDRGNPRYMIEVARLRLKAPILRIQAERLFRRALDAARQRHDPALEAEVQSEIGMIYFRRYD